MCCYFIVLTYNIANPEMNENIPRELLSSLQAEVSHEFVKKNSILDVTPSSDLILMLFKVALFPILVEFLLEALDCNI